MSTLDRARTLRDLHESPRILQLVNVWDAVSARVIAELPETRAIATAGHSIAASFGYPDGGMPLDVALGGIATIVDAVELPVSADLDDGYDDPGETVRRAIALGVVGANVEDRMRPLEEAVARVRAVTAAAEAEGVPFQLNARTDAFVRGEGDVEHKLGEAIARGRAFLAEGAALVFVPGPTRRDLVERLVEAFDGRLSIIGLPGALPAAEYERMGVARISYGPLAQRVALRALRDLGASLAAGGVIPEDTPALN
ncbi:isocitrate lyase/PEP mutase family protein [Protaetiibacter intestinalis]|uniref:Isocitrate lyase/phosphoenolpyruvate mutase family protein n=1 Tax=Protaetiibacter intestinalis TaxID=2419774 RepID=A0A387B787_9MICO|nr:isocitrate lyase/phosphoenolpyruvate mutase family protein [Protaetiibacter intestinalis]AYF97641.1 isocitrate lyase/phosphoenolpyruvate mutase family protein [Protaetiibacter intestinalis]